MSDGAVREKSLLEELQALEIPDHIKERIIKKYWDKVNESRQNIENVREMRRKEEENIIKELQDKNVIISVLIEHIRDRELL